MSRSRRLQEDRGLGTSLAEDPLARSPLEQGASLARSRPRLFYGACSAEVTRFLNSFPDLNLLESVDIFGVAFELVGIDQDLPSGQKDVYAKNDGLPSIDLISWEPSFSSEILIISVS